MMDTLLILDLVLLEEASFLGKRDSLQETDLEDQEGNLQAKRDQRQPMSTEEKEYRNLGMEGQELSLNLFMATMFLEVLVLLPLPCLELDKEMTHLTNSK